MSFSALTPPPILVATSLKNSWPPPSVLLFAFLFEKYSEKSDKRLLFSFEMKTGAWKMVFYASWVCAREAAPETEEGALWQTISLFPKTMPLHRKPFQKHTSLALKCVFNRSRVSTLFAHPLQEQGCSSFRPTIEIVWFECFSLEPRHPTRCCFFLVKDGRYFVLLFHTSSKWTKNKYIDRRSSVSFLHQTIMKAGGSGVGPVVSHVPACFRNCRNSCRETGRALF
ncbi:hypothetical protein CEXT_167321 [Caerostris extrusa]|uniref:Uncharacterized protein n=1 Tax=Caerostris extrusa TaxID=172846 RepID=A0AAV4W5X1_CAEEX|nr:hypothetical protein CEXT_167321 [Caerostris extrusa]